MDGWMMRTDAHDDGFMVMTTDGWMDPKCIDGWMDGWMDESQMHGCTDGWMHGCMDGCVDAWLHG